MSEVKNIYKSSKFCTDPNFKSSISFPVKTKSFSLCPKFTKLMLPPIGKW